MKSKSAFLEDFESEIRSLFGEEKDIYNWKSEQKKKETLLQHIKKLLEEVKLIIIDSEQDLYIEYFIEELKKFNFNFIEFDFSMYSFSHEEFDYINDESEILFE